MPRRWRRSRDRGRRGLRHLGEARAAFLERWSDRWPGATSGTRLPEMFAATKLDIVSVVTPDHLHVPSSSGPSRTGQRHLLREAACDEPGRGVADRERREEGRHPREHQLHAALGAGVCRGTSIVRADRAARQIVVESGGPRAMLFRNHTHTIDFLNYFAESDPTWVWAELEPGFESYGTTYTGDGGRDPSTEPAVNCVRRICERCTRVPHRTEDECAGARRPPHRARWPPRHRQ